MGAVLRILIFLILLGFCLSLAFGAYGQELSAEGFPQDYRPEDFTPEAAPEAVSSSAAVTPTGTRFNIEDLPRIGSPTATKAVVPPSLTEPLPQPGWRGNVLRRQPSVPAEVAEWGPVDGDDAGWGQSLWVGTDRAPVDAVLAEIVKRPPVGAVRRDMLRDVLLTRGKAPLREGNGNWLSQRATVLGALGMEESAWRLWQAVPEKLVGMDALTQRGWTEAALLAGQTGPACAQAQARVGKAEKLEDHFWRQAIVVCQLLEGKSDGARLSWQLVEESKLPVDAWLRSVVEVWLQGGDRPAAVASGKGRMPALAAALLAQRPDLLSVYGVNRLPDVVLRRLVNTVNLPLLLRLRAAERLAQMSGWHEDGLALSQIYKAMPMVAEGMRDPMGTARNTPDGTLARTVLWQAAVGDGPLGLRALSWQKWHERAIADGLADLAEVLPPWGAGIRPDPTLAWLAPKAVEIAWRRGGVVEAAGWLKILNESTTLPPVLERARAALRLKEAMWQGKSVSEDSWAAWLKGTDWSGEAARRIAARWLAALQGVGVTVPSGIWANGALPALANGLPQAAPDPLWLGWLTAAAQQNQTGLAVLLILASQAAEDETHPGWLQPRLATMRGLKLEGWAKRWGDAAVPVATAEVLLEAAPALPKVNAARRPEQKGREIGGQRPAGGDQDGLVLPPPRARSGR